MYLLRKYVRQADAAPLPEPSQPSDLATLRAGDLRDLAILAPALWAVFVEYIPQRNLPSPAFWWAMSVRF
jgi:hypothetical protein